MEELRNEHDEKSLEKFQKFIVWLGRSLQASDVDKNELVHGYFSMIFIGNREDPEILKRGGALCRPPWLTDENVSLQMV